MFKVQRSLVFAEPVRVVAVRGEEPALANFHPLILAVCLRTRCFPGGDPIELGLGIRAAAIGAAEAVLAACEARRRPRRHQTAARADAPVEAMRRLLELAYCLEVARRLGYLDDTGCAEVLALVRRAAREVSALAAMTPTAALPAASSARARCRPG